VLALAAAGSVFEMDVSVHRFGVLSFFLLRKFWSLLRLLSGCNLLLGNSLGSGSNSPYKAQQLSGYCCDNLPLVLAGCAQFHIPLMQPVLRLPRNLFRLFRDALLSSAQSVPDTWMPTIAPCGFDNDSSQMRVAGLSDTSASGSLAAGVFAGHSTAITHQLPSTAEAGYMDLLILKTLSQTRFGYAARSRSRTTS
jgi:hypothetical protein